MIRTFVDKLVSRVKREATVAIERTHVYVHSFRDRAAHVEVPHDVKIHRIEPERILEIGSLGFVEVEDWFDRLQRGDECYGAWVGGELAHYSWIQTRGEHPIGTAGRATIVQPGTFWIYNCRTSERSRGMHLYPRTLSVILRDYFARGLFEAWIYTTHQNVASQRGILRAGFKEIEQLRALRLGRWTRPLGESGAFSRIPAPGTVAPTTEN